MSGGAVLGALYGVYQLHQNRARPKPVDGSDEAYLALYRAELERQRSFHGGSWFWWRLAIFLPGPVIFGIGTAVRHPEQVRQSLVFGIFLAVMAVLAVPLNLGAARRYQRQIDDVDALRKPL